MRIGVFVGDMIPAHGGGYSLQASILDAVEKSSAPHQFFIFRRPVAKATQTISVFSARNFIRVNPILGPMARFIRTVLVSGTSRQLQSFEEKCVNDYQIDVAWFLSPIARPITIPYIATVWDLEHRKQPYFPEVSVTGWTWESREENFRRLLPRAMLVLTGTEAGKKEVITFYGVRPNNVRVVPHPASNEFSQLAIERREDVRAKYGLSNPFVFYPAQFWPHKNHVNLLHALRLLNEDAVQPIDLVLSGSDKGNLVHIRSVIHSLGLTEHVHVVGFIPINDIIELYREAIALVYATLFGPDNLPPLEAFAIGCPVAASRIDGASEQFGDAALLFDPLDPAAIAEAIRTIQHDDIRQELVKRGLELAAQKTPQRYLRQICEMLDEFEPLRRCWAHDYVDQ